MKINPIIIYANPSPTRLNLTPAHAHAIHVYFEGS